jgi:hypothetical protein
MITKVYLIIRRIKAKDIVQTHYRYVQMHLLLKKKHIAADQKNGGAED